MTSVFSNAEGGAEIGEEAVAAAALFINYTVVASFNEKIISTCRIYVPYYLRAEAEEDFTYRPCNHLSCGQVAGARRPRSQDP